MASVDRQLADNIPSFDKHEDGQAVGVSNWSGVSGQLGLIKSGREWALIALRLPRPKLVGVEANLRGGEFVTLYIISARCQWRKLPRDYQPFVLVESSLHDWRVMSEAVAIAAVLKPITSFIGPVHQGSPLVV